MILRVKDWDAHFENSASRKLVKLSWVPVPNKMDGEGYTALVDHPNGAAHLGAWLAIMEIASKQEPRTARGALPGGPAHDLQMICRSLGRISRLPAAIFEEVIPRLMAAPIVWLEVLSNQQSATPSGEPASTSGDSPDIAAANRTELNRTEIEEEPPIPPETAREYIDGTPTPAEPNAPTGACSNASPSTGVVSISDGIMARPTVRPARGQKRTIQQIKAALGEERLVWWENFWRVYPCHDGMREGLDAFDRKVTTREVALEVYRGAQRYAAFIQAQPDTKRKYPQGWLNDERWNDECVLPTPALTTHQERHQQAHNMAKLLDQMGKMG